MEELYGAFDVKVRNIGEKDDDVKYIYQLF